MDGTQPQHFSRTPGFLTRSNETQTAQPRAVPEDAVHSDSEAVTGGFDSPADPHGLHAGTDPVYPDEDPGRIQLLQSFDMLFRLHQRAEDICSHLTTIDKILLNSRTVEGLTRELIRALKASLDLVAVRILYREDHPIASLLQWDPPEGARLIPAGFLEDEGLVDSEPFVLDDPSGELAHNLFDDAARLVASAAVAVLCVDDEELGVLCLGSDDPVRYCGGMNTELIASLARNISLGIQNARDHEKRNEEAIAGRVDGVYSEAFFRSILRREFDRAWRYGRPFCLMALSWAFYSATDRRPNDEIMALLRSSIRSSDLVAHGAGATLWVLLPESDRNASFTLAQRLTELVGDTYAGTIALHAGITEFSRAAPVASALMAQTRVALEEAQAYDTGRIVVTPDPTVAASSLSGSAETFLEP